MKIGVLTSHPIQYQAPIFRELARHVDLKVFFAHKATSNDQAKEGFGTEFDWDVDLTGGYDNTFLVNVSKYPSVSRFKGCDTPGVKAQIQDGGFGGFLVMGWHLKAYWQAVRACKACNTAVVVRGDSHLDTNRAPLINLLKKPVYRSMLKAFDSYLFVGRRNRSYLEYYGASPDKLYFSPHAVDVDWFSERAVAHSDNKRELRRRYNIGEQAHVLLFVGKLQGIKRPQDLIEAAAGLAQKKLPVEVVFAGTGEMAGDVKKWARHAKFPVHLLGFINQSQMPRIYSLADVLVLPSESETWGLAVNEAMSCGTPAVVSDRVGCAPDLIEPGKTGFTYPVGNILALTDALEKILILTYSGDGIELALREKMDRYSPAVTCEGILTAIEEVAKA